MKRQKQELARFRAKLEDQRLDFQAEELRKEKARRNSHCTYYDESRSFREVRAARESLDGGAYSLRRTNAKGR